MAAVRIENEAWGDSRYAKLARLCGLSDPRFALILCGAVWSYCTDKKTYIVDGPTINTIALIDGFADHMVTALLAEKQKKGTYRIKGSKGRIEWLEKLKENAAKGGKQKAANRLASASQRLPMAKQPRSKGVASYSSSFSSSFSSSSSGDGETCELRARERGASSSDHQDPDPVSLLALWVVWEEVNGNPMGSPSAFERELGAIRGVVVDRAAKRATSPIVLFREVASAYVLSQREKKDRVNLVWLSKAFASLCDEPKPRVTGRAGISTDEEFERMEASLGR